MQNNLVAICVGVALGCFYGAILAICVDGFSKASVILYGDPYYIGVCVAVFCGILSYVTVVSYKLWAYHVQDAMVAFVDELQQGDELE